MKNHSHINYLLVLFISSLYLFYGCPDKKPCPTCPTSSVDTTSHDFIWTFDTLGGTQSRASGIWGSHPTDIYITGIFNQPETNYNLAHWDCTRWQYIQPPAFRDTNGLHAGEPISIFGLSSERMWVVGQGYDRDPFTKEILTWGYVASWDGKSWKTISPYAPGISFFGIWASSEKDVWITGSEGTLFHHNGSEWQNISSNTTFVLRDIWGTNANNILTVGWPWDYSTGIVLRYNGIQWNREEVMGLTSIASFWSVWISPSNVSWIASDAGLFRQRNNTWESLGTLGVQIAFLRVRGRGDNDVFLCGSSGLLMHYNGSTWYVYQSVFPGQENADFIDILVLDDQVFFVGRGGIGFDRRGIVLKGIRKIEN